MVKFVLHCLFFSSLCFSFTTSKGQSREEIFTLLKESEIAQSHFTGFVLYDLDADSLIYGENENKYFVPASNTKLYTMYTALQMLGDSIPSIRYTISGDSLIFWGTGDPTLFREDFNSEKVYGLLRYASQKLYYAYDNYQGNFYGRGWPYGDYDAYYQAEINALPFGGNLAHFYRDDTTGKLEAKPNYFNLFIQPDTITIPRRFQVTRDLTSNQFYRSRMDIPTSFSTFIPWKTSPRLTAALLEDTLKRPVTPIEKPMPKDAITVYSNPIDSVLKALMLPSDNFIAEQLLLVCSSTLGEELNTQKAIKHSLDNYLSDLPHKPNWTDGSGLSRSNLFTPMDHIEILKKLLKRIPDQHRLFSMLPAGGESGTLKNAYKLDRGEVFVWGKTGTLGGVHNQSGYIITRKGKRLLYSFQNNNYVRPTSEVRDEMGRIMTTIRKEY
ncbi:D-alanyl-D-alanine carboxypeptidase/D-alanyl-D-alanine-endopeptidase [Olivibacter sitiensis]|uniref:D-alanyl-D-alanine carboxypeptidase/D-alanyl-D-alanine-endopeptidase n=1 Tax=Olivibacter sitiensis TaxID=376470 RepID=UPI0003F83B49|nr:D-alanyl-D-alanine carboxypeptidase [Olivibacter sitiensis]